jgi:integrase
MGLGSAVLVTLQEARRRAQIAYLQLLDGVNPLEEKRARRVVRHVAEKSKPFEWCAREYLNTNQKIWKGDREAKRFCQVIADFINPHIGTMPVRDITKEHIVKVLNPIWQTKATTAKRVRRYLEHILGWAEDKGLRSGNNPATTVALRHLLGRQSKAATKVTHHPSMPWKEVGAFVRALRADSAIRCRALELLILTALRTNEVIGARWTEFDWDAKIWTIPGERMKAGEKHDVPISSAMLRLLAAMPKVAGNPYVFPGKGSGGKLNLLSMQRWIRVIHGDSVSTVHGFRSSFRTWAAECTNYPREIVEMALAHAVGNQVEAAYQRSKLIEKRRPLMEDWGEFVTRPPADVLKFTPAHIGVA